LSDESALQTRDPLIKSLTPNFCNSFNYNKLKLSAIVFAIVVYEMRFGFYSFASIVLNSSIKTFEYRE